MIYYFLVCHLNFGYLHRIALHAFLSYSCMYDDQVLGIYL